MYLKLKFGFKVFAPTLIQLKALKLSLSNISLSAFHFPVFLRLSHTWLFFFLAG